MKPTTLCALILAASLPAGETPDGRRERLRAEAAALLAPIEEAGGYADADAHLPARVDRGDGVPVPLVVRVPVMRKRALLPAATWEADEERVLDLPPEPAPGDGGIMVLEVAEDPSLPLVHLHPSAP